MTKSLDTFNGEVAATVVGYAGTAFVFMVPLIIFLLLFFPIETLKKDSCMNIFGILYEGLKMHNKF